MGMHCSFYEWDEADEEHDKERCAMVPASFWFRVAMAYGRKAREEGLTGHGSRLDPCEYHGTLLKKSEGHVKGRLYQNERYGTHTLSESVRKIRELREDMTP